MQISYYAYSHCISIYAKLQVILIIGSYSTQRRSGVLKVEHFNYMITAYFTVFLMKFNTYEQKGPKKCGTEKDREVTCQSI